MVSSITGQWAGRGLTTSQSMNADDMGSSTTSTRYVLQCIELGDSSATDSGSAAPCSRCCGHARLHLSRASHVNAGRWLEFGKPDRARLQC